MSHICSIHRDYNPNCPLCNTTIWEFCKELGLDYEAMHAEAEAVGIHKCERCGFEYYKTVEECPSCGQLRKGESV
jgi:hypothetical protein